MSSVILGTAQWGAPYGATNRRGVPSDEEILEQVAVARAMGAVRLDTAAGYGNSEQRIIDLRIDMPVQTKFACATLRPDQIPDAVREAHRRFGDRLEAVLVHDWSQLNEAQALGALDGLSVARNSVGVGIGISGYDLGDVDRAAARAQAVDVLQMPVNVLDQRLEASTGVRELRARGARLQARSIFLQGILIGAEAVPLSRHPDVAAFRAACRDAGRSSLSMAVAYVASRPWIDDVIVAASTPDELLEIADAWSQGPLESNWDDLASDDLELIDPRRWASLSEEDST